jgi:phosphoserine phosphatase
MIEILKFHIANLHTRRQSAGLENTPLIAVFDLDGTLIRGDIGDAVFAMLLQAKHELGLTWSHYRHLLRQHRSLAYVEVVKAMAGLQRDTVADITREVMQLSESYLQMNGDALHTPKPRKLFQELIPLLKDQGFDILVVSASNDVSVRVVTEQWFGIPSDRSFGIKLAEENGVFTSQIMDPVPIGFGKTEIFRTLYPGINPFLTVTDSRLDIPLLRTTHPLGFSIWVGSDQLNYKAVLSSLQPAHRILVVEGEESEASIEL